MKNLNKMAFLKALPAIALLVIITFGCSSEPSYFVGSASVNKFQKDGKVTKYSFHTHKNGESIFWKVVLKDGEIETLYKNGEKLSAEEIEKYKNMIMTRIHKFDDDFISLDDYDFDFTVPDIDLEFNNKEFREQMEKMKEELKKLKDIRVNVNFDRKEFNESMKKLNKKLRKLNDKDFFDADAFGKSMEEFRRNLKEHPINIDINFDELNKNMAELKIKMKDFKIDMSGLKEKLHKLKEFLLDVKSELVKDGYLDDEDDDFSMEFTKDKLIINGKRLPDNLLEKYKKMYKEHFGHEINDKFRICN